LTLRTLTRRRPSASIVISSAALFLSLGGVGYAATALPSNSVGTSQIRSNAVTYQKIAPNSVGKIRLADGGVINSKLAEGSVSYKDIQDGAVGTKRANLDQLQARVFKTCAAGSAIGAISSAGAPTCNSTLPAEYGTTDVTTTLTAAAATVTTKPLPAGADYLGFANTELSATSGSTTPVRVTVSCTLTVGSTSDTRSVMLATTDTVGVVTTAQLPLQVAGASGTGTETCTATAPTGVTLPAVTATSSLNAIQTSSVN
jgi:hypothetical protein